MINNTPNAVVIVANVTTTANPAPLGLGVPPLNNPPGSNIRPNANTNIDVACKPCMNVSAGNKKFVSYDAQIPNAPAIVNANAGNSISQSMKKSCIYKNKNLAFSLKFINYSSLFDNTSFFK